MAGTPRLSLPFLTVGQAQKEFTVNEGLSSLDVLVAGAVEGPPLAEPPAAPVLGACYIVAEAATNAWMGKEHCVAAWTSGGWRFVSPVDGMSFMDRSSGTQVTFRNGAWEMGLVRCEALLIDGQQLVGPRSAAIESPAGGAVADSEARAAVDAILDTLRQHGLIEV